MRRIIANSARSYILADSSKLGQVAPYRVCEFSAVDGLITDQNTDPLRAAAIEETGGVVLSARPTDMVRAALQRRLRTELLPKQSIPVKKARIDDRFFPTTPYGYTETLERATAGSRLSPWRSPSSPSPPNLHHVRQRSTAQAHWASGPGPS